MFCYNCGTDCKEDRFCSNCGCRVGKPEEREKIYPDPPLGAYWGTVCSYLEVRKDSIRIHVDDGSASVHKCFRLDRVIPFENISHVEMKDGMISTYLIIREKGNVYLSGDYQLSLDKDINAFRFQTSEKPVFKDILAFLRKCCEINNNQ